MMYTFDTMYANVKEKQSRVHYAALCKMHVRSTSNTQPSRGKRSSFTRLISLNGLNNNELLNKGACGFTKKNLIAMLKNLLTGHLSGLV